MAISTILTRPKISDGFKNWFKDYLANSSVAGCVYYIASGTGRVERIFWLAGHITCIICAVYMIVNATLIFMRIPTMTTAEPSEYPIQNVDFPGVAICGLNKINYSAAMEIAEDILYYNDIGNFTLKEVADMLKYLGHLYLFELNDGEEGVVDLLHDLLIKRYKKYVPHLLRKLTPSCQWILEYCSWGGKEKACEDIFIVRKTGEGYCCTFNYARSNDDFSSKNGKAESWGVVDIEHSKDAGPRFGLTVLIRSDIPNHHYKIHPALGHKILIYPPMDFPDVPSGGVREVLVSPRTEVSLSLQATPFYSVPEVLKYSVSARGCLFSHEMSLIFGKFYSYSDCIMHCRINDILKLCHCIPFFYPRLTDEAPARICNLRDLSCLRKYRGKWMKISPRTERRMASSPIIFPDGSNSSLNCTTCFPACTDVLYKVSTTSAPLTSRRVFMGRDMYEILEGHSIVHIFFKRGSTIRLKQDVLFYWYDLLSHFGGICGLFLGVSVISVVEIIYFCTLRLYNRKYGMREERKSRITFVRAAKLNLRPLYWNEMIQPNTKY